MNQAERVLPADSDEAKQLLADGWVVEWRSFGAELDPATIDLVRLAEIAATLPSDLEIRQLAPADAAAARELDARTLGDYPGGPPTQHGAMSAASATPSPTRVAFGVFDKSQSLVADTYLDVDPEARTAETDFTVVDPAWRGRGIGQALKAYSIIALSREEVTHFRTGGAAENTGIWAANRALAYVIDDEWLTLTPPNKEFRLTHLPDDPATGPGA